uniref:Uncharacterized protein n=1 Tax=Sphaerodactylus townsendi TaxID=933632 RepID=A0ACB8F0I6_9SAUR
MAGTDGAAGGPLTGEPVGVPERVPDKDTVPYGSDEVDEFEEEMAHPQLRQIWQGPQPMSEYVAESCQLAGVVQGWPELVKVHFFREGFHPEMAQWSMVSAELTSLAGGYTWMGMAEIHLRRVQLLEQQSSPPARDPAAGSSSARRQGGRGVAIRPLTAAGALPELWQRGAQGSRMPQPEARLSGVCREWRGEGRGDRECREDVPAPDGIGTTSGVAQSEFGGRGGGWLEVWWLRVQQEVGEKQVTTVCVKAVGEKPRMNSIQPKKGKMEKPTAGMRFRPEGSSVHCAGVEERENRQPGVFQERMTSQEPAVQMGSMAVIKQRRVGGKEVIPQEQRLWAEGMGSEPVILGQSIQVWINRDSIRSILHQDESTEGNHIQTLRADEEVGEKPVTAGNTADALRRSSWLISDEFKGEQQKGSGSEGCRAQVPTDNPAQLTGGNLVGCFGEEGVLYRELLEKVSLRGNEVIKQLVIPKKFGEEVYSSQSSNFGAVGY